MAGFKLPVDAIVLSVPIAYACFAFSSMVTRIFTVDPEFKSNTNANLYYENEGKSSADAQYYNDSLRHLFQERIREKKTGVFTNVFGTSPQ